jgi:hypothetical protein
MGTMGLVLLAIVDNCQVRVLLCRLHEQSLCGEEMDLECQALLEATGSRCSSNLASYQMRAPVILTKTALMYYNSF